MRAPCQGRVTGRPEPRYTVREQRNVAHLTRRELFLLSLTAWRAWPQPPYPGTLYRDYSRCLPDYLRDLALHSYQTRNAEISRLTSAVAIAKRQQWVRDTLWQIVGGKPERTPLRPRTLGSFDRPGYRLEKVVYESQPE